MKGYEYLVNYLRIVNVEYHEGDQIWFIHRGRIIFVDKLDHPACRILCLHKTEGYDLHDLLKLCSLLNLDRIFLKYAVVDSVVWCAYEFTPTDDTTFSQYNGYIEAVIEGIDRLFDSEE